MKPTKKRLSLNRETIRGLESTALRRINGGLMAETDTSMTTDCCSVGCSQHCKTWPEAP